MSDTFHVLLKINYQSPIYLTIAVLLFLICIDTRLIINKIKIFLLLESWNYFDIIFMIKTYKYLFILFIFSDSQNEKKKYLLGHF